jgi:hypothetical protein
MMPTREQLCEMFGPVESAPVARPSATHVPPEDPVNRFLATVDYSQLLHGRPQK